MAMRTLASTALVITVASALQLELDRSGPSALINLPRTVVQTTAGCGRNITGYLLMGEGRLWKDRRPGYASNPMACRQKCDASKHCIAFTARYPRKGKMQCDLYRGMVKKFDPRSKAYSKCAKGHTCTGGEEFNGFQFAHEGTWKGATMGNGKTLKNCASVCRSDKTCTGFVHHHNKNGVGQCLYVWNEADGAGPQRDARAMTYSKCIDSTKAPEPETPQPQASDPEAPEPDTLEPGAAEPEAAEPEAAEPEVAEPEAVKPQASEPEAPKPETSQPLASEPQAAEPEAPKPEVPEPQASQPQDVEQELPKPEAEEDDKP